MTNDDMTSENEQPTPEAGTPTDRRPLGYWLRMVDGLIAGEFASALAEEGVSRRDWMVLSALAGDVEIPGFAARLARGGKRLRSLAERGWVTETGSGFELTDAGRAAQARLSGIVQQVREKVSSAVSPEDWATLTASLEAIARELGGDDDQWMARGRRFGAGGRGFGRGRGAGFAPGWGAGFGPGFRPERGHGHPGFGHPGFGPGFGPAFGPEGRMHGHPMQQHGQPRHGHAGHEHHGHPHRKGHQGGQRKAERAYERGFEAGFRAAQSGAASDSAA